MSSTALMDSPPHDLREGEAARVDPDMTSSTAHMDSPPRVLSEGESARFDPDMMSSTALMDSPPCGLRVCEEARVDPSSTSDAVAPVGEFPTSYINAWLQAGSMLKANAPVLSS